MLYISIHTHYFHRGLYIPRKCQTGKRIMLRIVHTLQHKYGRSRPWGPATWLIQMSYKCYNFTFHFFFDMAKTINLILISTFQQYLALSILLSLHSITSWEHVILTSWERQMSFAVGLSFPHTLRRNSTRVNIKGRLLCRLVLLGNYKFITNIKWQPTCLPFLPTTKWYPNDTT